MSLQQPLGEALSTGLELTDGQIHTSHLGPQCVRLPSPPFLGMQMLPDPASTQADKMELQP